MKLAFLIVLVVIATLAAHWPVLSAQAIAFDDGQYLTENPLVQHPSWSSAGRFLCEVLHPSTVEGYYQPLAMISLMLDYAAGGRPDDLRPFHRTSLILHVTNTVLVIVLLYMLFGRPWEAAAVGLLFGVHPITVEPIAWIGERKTLLAALFALCCLIAYVRYARRLGWRPYVTCLVLYILAVLSKPTSAPLPVVLLLLDFWPLKRLSRRTAVEKAPFFLIAGVSAVITIISQRHLELSAFRELSAGQTFLLACHNLVLYPFHMIWPVRLSAVYPFPESVSLSNTWLLTCVIVSALMLGLVLISLRRTRALLTGWLCFVFLLSPTLLNKSYSPSVAWDKYAYLPAVGLLLILAWLFERIVSTGTDTRRRAHQAGIVILVIVVAGVLATGTRRYLSHWQTTEGFCDYMLDRAPNSALLYNHRGLVYRAKGDYDGAIRDYSKAIELKADYVDAYSNRGNAYFSRGDHADALRDYTRAIDLLPSYAKAYNNRAVTHFLLRQYDSSWADVRMCRQFGGTPTPDFVRALAAVTGRTE